MKKFVFGLFVSLLFMPHPANAADYMTGQGLLDLCTSQDSEAVGACKGYILGTADTTALVIGLDPTIRQHISEASQGMFAARDVVAIVTKFLRDRANAKTKDGKPVLSLGATGFVWAALEMNRPSASK